MRYNRKHFDYCVNIHEIFDHVALRDLDVQYSYFHFGFNYLYAKFRFLDKNRMKRVDFNHLLESQYKDFNKMVIMVILNMHENLIHIQSIRAYS